MELPPDPARRAAGLELPAVRRAVLGVLADSPAGISEHALMKRLGALAIPGFHDATPRDPLALFRCHFLLFHVLYTLRDELAATQQGTLFINALHISLTPFETSSASAVAPHDALRDYYLDLEHLFATGRHEVERLLGDFWRRVGGGEERLQALEVLGLAEPVDYAAIKERHRRLVMQHHPDRGGEHATLLVINEAMDVLERYYAPPRA